MCWNMVFIINRYDIKFATSQNFTYIQFLSTWPPRNCGISFFPSVINWIGKINYKLTRRIFLQLINNENNSNYLFYRPLPQKNQLDWLYYQHYKQKPARAVISPTLQARKPVRPVISSTLEAQKPVRPVISSTLYAQKPVRPVISQTLHMRKPVRLVILRANMISYFVSFSKFFLQTQVNKFFLILKTKYHLPIYWFCFSIPEPQNHKDNIIFLFRSDITW